MTALTKFLTKAADKGADFLPPRAAALVEERIAALRAVREAVAGKAKYLDRGYSAKAYETQLGDKVVKVPHYQGEINHWATKKFKRRGFLESILADNGLAPRTMLVETSGQKYMVQPKADYFSPVTRHPNAQPMRDAMEKIGMTSTDTAFNIGEFGPGNIPKLIDASEEKLTRAMTPAERASALEKFISKGKRKKPWLDE